MPRTCTICNHSERKIIDAMVVNKDPYLRIAEKFKLNANTVTSHGKKHVLPFIDSIELQAQAAVLERVMQYRDEVNLPLPEKSKYVENKLWADYYDAETLIERMAVMREINKQQIEQAKLASAYLEKVQHNVEVRHIRVIKPAVPVDLLEAELIS